MDFETLYEDLASCPEIIRALVSNISDEDARLRPAPDSWSVVEVICHLYDEEREDFREHLDLILNRPHDEWKRINPGAWVTERNYNERSLAEMLVAFAAEREKSLEWLTNLTAPDWDTKFTTPFRTMTAGDMFASWVAHDNLHMRQLIELRRARLVRNAEPRIVEYAGDW